jgi:hypothetical protein
MEYPFYSLILENDNAIIRITPIDFLMMILM